MFMSLTPHVCWPNADTLVCQLALRHLMFAPIDMNLQPTTSPDVLPEPSESFEWRQASWGRVLVCRPFDEVATHFFTGRELQLRGDDERAREDWARVAEAIGVTPERLRRMRQVHGCEVFTVNGSAAVTPDLPPQVDALISDRDDVALAVQVADCVPLLLADPRTGAVAATHAGWRGTAGNIAGATVARLAREYGAQPAHLIAAIGPSIGACCFQVGPDVRDAFLTNARAHDEVERWFSPDTGDRLRLDIWQANRDQLVRAGLAPERVHVAALCTATHRAHFFSYRREQQSTGRMLGVVRSRAR
jgi:polyphenol oxidase